MNTLGILNSKWSKWSTLQKIKFITNIYILYYQSSIHFQLSPNLAGFLDILN